eukprot:3932367-Lingulodinium_polyedra.AAC.1
MARSIATCGENLCANSFAVRAVLGRIVSPCCESIVPTLCLGSSSHKQRKMACAWSNKSRSVLGGP